MPSIEGEAFKIIVGSSHSRAGEQRGKMRVILTSVVRHAEPERSSGFIRVFDMERKKVLLKAPLPESMYRAQDSNPRGGLRGGKGVSVYGNLLLIANAERIMVFDKSWNLEGIITHPLMGGVHEILAEADGIWITCTSADLLLKVDWDGKLLDVWEWRRDKELTSALGFRGLPTVNRKLDYRDPQSMRDGVRNIIHLNSVTRGDQGLLLSFGRILSSSAYKDARVKSMIGRLAQGVGVEQRKSQFMPIPANEIPSSSWAAVLLREDGTTQILKRLHNTKVPNHNVIQIQGLLVYNDTNASRVVATSLSAGGQDYHVEVPGQPGFVRGLAHLNNDSFLVGSQAPASIYQVDLRAERVTSQFILDGEPHESIFGICVLPSYFEDPKPSLAQNTQALANSIP